MMYLGSPRFVVREAHGYDMRYESRATTVGPVPLAALVVLDRAYCFAKVAEFYLDEVPQGGIHWEQHRRHAELYDRAETYCAELNARVAGVQAGDISTAAALLSPGDLSPSLSPFDSGCPR